MSNTFHSNIDRAVTPVSARKSCQLAMMRLVILLAPSQVTAPTGRIAMQRQRPSILSMVALIVCAPIIAAAVPPSAAVDHTGPNKAIARRASGVYRYESIKDGRVRGEDRWQFFAHPDGSRTLSMWHDLAARDAQFTVVLRVESSFRPIDAFVSYWNAGLFKGSAHFHVAGNSLLADSFGPYGARHHTIAVPERFSIGTHPVAADGGNEPVWKYHEGDREAETGGDGAERSYGVHAAGGTAQD